MSEVGGLWVRTGLKVFVKELTDLTKKERKKEIECFIKVNLDFQVLFKS